ncbi:MAG: hypothetical protein KKE44_22195 [Proteobacteria bacterium]|nr:hypothetical protein [Pseudomonadota bacterium]MBU1585447.1 hypothetical protein [Pseudomonadota bacterium]MBU2630011.1 hypothetical protein [Pseudomonadota bacterium]
MKILSSEMVFLSDHHFEQMDASLNEKTTERTVRQNLGSMENTGNLPQVLVDRVSISQNETHEYQSYFSADIKGKSSVKSLASTDTIEMAQTSAMERLIGGIIDKEVVISSIQRKEDIHFSDTTIKVSNDPDTAGSLVQTNSTQSWEMSLKQTDIHFEEETVAVSSSGEVTTEDGRIINFSLDMSLDRAFLSRTEKQTLVQRWQERINLTDPLVISLDGKAPQLLDAVFEFDLTADGKMEKISFAGPGSGFLAFDKNNDARINNGSELFGPGTGNGFEELAAFDEDQNNWIDENDTVFSKLSVWTRDENGRDMLISLKDAGIGAIALDSAATAFNMTQSDNVLQGQLKSTGMFLFENGNVGSIHQIDLASRQKNEIEEKRAEPPLENIQAASPPIPGIVSLATVMNEPPQNITNPMKDLLDRIKKLKQEMERLYEKMSPASHQNRFRHSGRQQYYRFDPDPSVLLFGKDKGPVRPRSRYA